MIGWLHGFGPQWWTWRRRGPNVVQDSGWTPGIGVTVNAGALSVGLSLTPTVATQIVGLVPGRSYEVATNVSGISVLGGGIAVSVGGVQLPAITTTGATVQRITAGSDGTIQVVRVGALGFIGQIASVAVNEIR